MQSRFIRCFLTCDVQWFSSLWGCLERYSLAVSFMYIYVVFVCVWILGILIYKTKRTQCHIPWAIINKCQMLSLKLFLFAGSICSGTTSLERSPEHFGKSRYYEKPSVGVRLGCIGWILNMLETVDERSHPANQLRLVVYPIIYRVLHIPGQDFFHQQSVLYNMFLSFLTPYVNGKLAQFLYAHF